MIGQILNDTYQLTDLIGSGGYANVYRARDVRTGAVVAVKVLHPHLARDPDTVARFEREIALARRLQTPAIARILDAGRDPMSPPYMVMEFVSGQPVAQLVDQHGPLPVTEAAEIVDQLLGALRQAHVLGIIHRDLKPHNLMLDATGRVRVLDFGVSRVTGAGTITADGQILGTPEYMAPEQLAGQPIDARADLYAVGAVLYHLLAGRPPYLRTTETDLWEMVRRVRRELPPPIAQLRPDIPLALVAVVEQAMAREVDQRYASAFEMQQALAVAAGADAPTPAPFSVPHLNPQPQTPMPPAPPSSAPAPAPLPHAQRPPRRPVDDQQQTTILSIPPDLAAASKIDVAPTPAAPPTPPSAPWPAPPAPTRVLPPQSPGVSVAGAERTQIMGTGNAPTAHPQGASPAAGRPPAPPPEAPRGVRAGQPAPPPSQTETRPGSPLPPDAAGAGAPSRRLSRRPATRWIVGTGVAVLLIGLGVAIGRLAALPARTSTLTPTAVVGAARTTGTPAPAPVATSSAAVVQAGSTPTALPAGVPPPPAGAASPTAGVAVAPPPAALPPAVASPPVVNAFPTPPGSGVRPAPSQNAPPPPGGSAPAPPAAPGVIAADTFDGAEGGLLTRTSPRPNDYVFVYERGEYAIKKLNPTLPAAPIVFLRGEYKDTVIAVDVRIVGEAASRYAFLVCRDSSASGQTRQYRASIVPEGRRMILSVWGDGEQKVLAETRDNPAIQIANAINRLELRCAGRKIEAIVNGKTVLSVEDSTLTSGEHGLGAGTFSGVEGVLEARFDNLEVRQP